ncbi:MAG: hypothetical protein DWH99_07635 [Planctomycetota bacterium]|nr:MAG: hypothetical protein DWH99_07635 [Planctomycetota bacterium]
MPTIVCCSLFDSFGFIPDRFRGYDFRNAQRQSQPTLRVFEKFSNPSKNVPSLVKFANWE